MFSLKPTQLLFNETGLSQPGQYCCRWLYAELYQFLNVNEWCANNLSILWPLDDNDIDSFCCITLQVCVKVDDHCMAHYSHVILTRAIVHEHATSTWPIVLHLIPAKPLHNHDIVSVHFNNFYCNEIGDKLRRDLAVLTYIYLNDQLQLLIL